MATHRQRARGRLHSHERARGHVQPRCRGGGNVGRGKGCRRRHRSGGGSPASRDADGRGIHSGARRTSNRAGRWQADGPSQQKPARRHDHSRVIAGAFNPRSRCARSPRPTRVGGRWYARLVKGQCTCSSGFSTGLSHRVGWCFKWDSSLAEKVSVRSGFHFPAQNAT